MKNGGEDLPSDIQLVITNKVRVIALESIENESFVGLRNVGVRESLLIGEVKFNRNSTRVEPRKLVVHFEVYSFIGLNAHHKLVPRDIGENTLRSIFVLHTNFDFGLVQSF